MKWRDCKKNTLPSIAESKIRNIDHDKFVTIVHLNVRNVMAKKEDLKCDFNIQKAGIICFTESHLDKNDKITPNEIGLGDNMEIFCCDRNNHGGGVIICVHSWYKPTVLQVDQCGLELIGVEIHVQDPIIIFCLYRPPTYSCQTFMQKVGEVLNDYTYSPLCIVGDFNEDILENSDTNTQDISKCCFTQHVKSPTRDSGTLFDHVYTHHMQEVETEVSDTYFSDHDTVYCYIKVC